MFACLSCGKEPKRKAYKYCSNKCQRRHQYLKFIELWKKESEKGNNIITSTNISHHIRRFLIEKYNESCSLCGWNIKHPVTGSVPLEIDHKDGNASNNRENNLRILCPSCYSLTPNLKT